MIIDLPQSPYVSITLHSLLWVVGFLVLSRISLLKNGKTLNNKNFPLSIIIPARNEESRLPKLLESLKNQTFPPLEIIVVNDHSEDNTKIIAETYGAKVVNSKNLPPGWLGKPWACHEGAQAAKGGYFLFLDADVFLELDALQKMMNQIEEKGGTISIQPYHFMEKIFEQFSLIFNIIQMISSNAFTIWGSAISKKNLFGPVLLIKKEDYVQIGGYERVRNKVVENYFLSKCLLENRIPIHCFGGKGTVSFRMYPESFKSLSWGWAKSFGKGAQGTSIWVLLGSIGWLTGCLGTTRHLLLAAGDGDVFRFSLLVFIYFLFSLQIYWMGSRMGQYRWETALLFPIPVLFFVGVFFWSLFLLVFNKRIIWKGRGIAQ